MNKTTEAFPPLLFLQVLRQVNPQFGERSRNGGGFAQQDADECWSQIMTSLTNAGVGPHWTEQFMSGEMETTYEFFFFLIATYGGDRHDVKFKMR